MRAVRQVAGTLVASHPVPRPAVEAGLELRVRLEPDIVVHRAPPLAQRPQRLSPGLGVAAPDDERADVRLVSTRRSGARKGVLPCTFIRRSTHSSRGMVLAYSR